VLRLFPLLIPTALADLDSALAIDKSLSDIFVRTMLEDQAQASSSCKAECTGEYSQQILDYAPQWCTGTDAAVKVLICLALPLEQGDSVSVAFGDCSVAAEVSSYTL
jgi:hypothetical protein